MDIDLAALVGLTPADASCLQSLKPQMTSGQDEVINAFYGRILSFPHFKEMIERTCEREMIDIGQLVAHINDVQFKHWQRFFNGTPDEAFKNFAHKIGIAHEKCLHEKCLLSSDLYVASSAVILEKFLGLALDQHLGDTGQAATVKASLSAIVRMFFLDISHAISAYDNAAARTAFQHVSELLLNAFEVEVAGDLKSMAGAAERLNNTIKNIVEVNLGNMQRCRDTVSSIETLTRNLADLAQTTRQRVSSRSSLTSRARPSCSR